MVEQADARKGHGDVVLVAGGDDVVVPDGAAGLGDDRHAGLVGPLDVVAEGEEGVAAQGDTGHLVQPGPLFLSGQRLRLGTWSNSLNVAQTLEKSSYSVSLGNTHQDGIIPKTGMDRYNVKVSAETKLTNNFTTGFAGNYITTSIDKAVTSGNGLLRTVYASPASYDLAGIPSHVDGDIYKQNSFRGNFDNAYWAIDNNKYTEDTNRFFGNVYATYQTDFGTANHKLNAKYMLGVDAYTTHYSDSYGYGSNTGGGRGQIENYGWTNATYNSLLTINYDWRINDDWGLNAVAGNEFIQSNRKKYYEYGTNYNFAGWNHINNATTQLTEEERWKNRTVGFFGNVSASYRNMLYLTVTGRQDYVSNMPRNNRSFFYPSVSAGFILTELDELKNDVVNYAKLRVSYAEVGQAGDFLENYYSTPTYGGGFYSLTPIMYPIKGTTAYTPYYTIFDPNLKPQNTRSYEIGADVNFFDNLITLNYTYSRQNVKDQIFSVPLSSSTGASKLLTNGGKIHTDTHEITLGFNPIRTKNINWDFGFNWTKIDNYVDELAPGVENISPCGRGSMMNINSVRWEEKNSTRYGNCSLRAILPKATTSPETRWPEVRIPPEHIFLSVI